MFLPDEQRKGERLKIPAMQRTFLEKLYNWTQPEAMNRNEGEVLWIDNSEEHPISLVVFVQVSC